MQKLGALLLAGAITACSADAADSSATPVDSGPPSPKTFGPIESGIATFYAATGAGNCSYDATPGDLDVVALDSRQYAGGAWCGACLRVDGPRGTIKVRVVDSCPSCESRTHIDLSESAFAKIANVVDGRVPVRWQFISCAVSGPLSYRFKEGSNEWWTAVQVRNHPYPIQSLEAKVSGAWSALVRSDYGYFIADKGLGKGPYELRVTSVNGQAVIDTGIVFAEGKVVSGASRFD